MTRGPQSKRRANPGRKAITEEGPGGLDLPLKSNFINVALQSISRKRHWRETKGTQLTANIHAFFPPGCSNSLFQVTEADISSGNRFPCRGKTILGFLPIWGSPGEKGRILSIRLTPDHQGLNQIPANAATGPWLHLAYPQPRSRKSCEGSFTQRCLKE